MAEFTDDDLAGAEFTDVRLTDARFRSVDLSGSRFRLVDLSGVTMRAVDLHNVTIDGWAENLVINGVDVGPLIEAELDRRHPERLKLRPTDPRGFGEAWELISGLWASTVDRARRLPPELLNESVDEEWSFIQTLRHLVFATDAWILRTVLGDPSPWDALDLPHDQMPNTPGVPRNLLVRPALDEILELRVDRQSVVRRVIDELTEEKLSAMTTPVEAPGYPESQSYSVRGCLLGVIDEEWSHRQYAERDLAVLESR
ncbi:DinB family protein [Microlunatus sp. Gsoil 973]|uniref:DinB family protein n=1 Tax=Microlunatus sp. Gsoil 973 TaxID=2672569 RepID=UPI0012B450E2|nr:DinB family protein [Microlunatus sp. Gsoil 973]QGN32492.1 DinB family protein [Microlunatus sp. Gsoil 973]